ncbi:XRE family transcriptional regulator [Brevibacillus formosus]|uniref:XRE family transcriptional regulator n=1 Tax=Brevibacillus formosus TaxID=54913 RepID=UPI0018CF6572|nr:XRE family transcriptional regulator [Brevibacillus formosus]MBG9944646.1 hypothetical protein [Brevibacillus formosus]
MMYAKMLKNGIQDADLSLAQICRRLSRKGVILDKAILSKLQNGKLAPARDEINVALADVLGIDSKKFRIAAVKETLSGELLELIKDDLLSDVS